jgi:hypothetical protein
MHHEDESAAAPQPNLRLFSPLLILSARAKCWHCIGELTAVGLGAHALEEEGEVEGNVAETGDMFTIRELDVLPDDVMAELVARNPGFKRQHSNTAGSSYYGNTCPHCGKLTGDFYLFAQPGGAFFPTTEADAAGIKVERLAFPEPVAIGGSWGYGIGEFILAHATVVDAPLRS